MQPPWRKIAEAAVAVTVPILVALLMAPELRPILPYAYFIWMVVVARSIGFTTAIATVLVATVLMWELVFSLAEQPLAMRVQRLALFAVFAILLAFVSRRASEASRRAAARLEESRRRLQALFDTVLDAVLFFDDHGRYVDVNPAASTILGWSRDEIVGKRMGAFSDAANAARHHGVLQEILTAGKASGETTIVDKAGRARHIAYRATGNVLPGLHVTVMQDITERREAERAVRRLSGKLLRLQDDERRRLARQLHDTTAQNLAAVRLNLARIGLTMEDDALREPLHDSIDLVDQSIAEIRTLSYLLHPPLIDEAGLLATLRWYARGFQTRSGIRVTLDLPDELERLPSEVETSLFRILQEALTNIQRHSGSKVARIRIAREANGVRLEVADEGRGIPQQFRTQQEALFASGLGMSGIRERARELGGDMEIRSGDGGTTLAVTLPLRAAEAV